VRIRRQAAPATFAMMGAILIGFGIEIATGAWKNSFQLAELGAIIPEYVRAGQYWRLVTAMFLHGDGTVGGDILHLTFNLFALYQVGSLFEMMFGTRRFLEIYFLAGIAASITSASLNHGASVGASGAIFGIIGAFVIAVRRSPRWRHQRVAKSIVNQLLFWIVANFVIALRIPEIDSAAHVGGLIAGAILAAILPQRLPPPPPPGQVIVDVHPYDG
jgi:rhomboid protease GluP